MNEDKRSRIVASEAAVERKYKDQLAQSTQGVQCLLARSVANTWTTQTDTKAPYEGELVGRIDLGAPNDVIGGARDFYIGSAKHDGPDFQVYSWAAPIAACTYYAQAADRNDLEGVASAVAGVRIFAHRLNRITDFQDEVVGDVAEGGLFPLRALSIPRAPGPRPARPSAQPVKAPTTTASGPVTSSAPVTSAPLVPAQPAKSQSAPLPVIPPGPSLRAPDLLCRQLASPKTVHMSTVLATLQPDQYEAITKPMSDSQILQGHPGTGKTIIAAHRAAYLLDEESAGAERPTGPILILGPTAEYVAHIRGALGKLIDDPSKYTVRSIPSLLEEAADLPKTRIPTQTVRYEDVDPELAGLIDLAFRNARASAGEWPTRGDIYAELLWLLEDPPTEGLSAEWVRYLRGLPKTMDAMRTQRKHAHRGLLAYIGVRADRARSHPGHVIVDEAQDIHPLEWHVLGRLGNTSGWTILGDLNQRRTDHTFSNWGSIAELLGIEDENGQAPVTVLERGYRSTMQIMRYANQLLPRQHRGVYSLQQDGEAPTITRASSAGTLIEQAITAAEALCERVGQGTVAMITPEAREVERGLVTRGWTKKRPDAFAWERGTDVLRVLPPEHARGLEFDGVVVIEPADFPENVGRQGVLYTALTRANRHLTVIHHRALPDALRNRR